jgi:hypothetical protein
MTREDVIAIAQQVATAIAETGTEVSTIRKAIDFYESIIAYCQLPIYSPLPPTEPGWYWVKTPEKEQIVELWKWRGGLNDTRRGKLAFTNGNDAELITEYCPQGTLWAVCRKPEE